MEVLRRNKGAVVKMFNKRKMIIGMLISICTYGVTKYAKSTTIAAHEDSMRSVNQFIYKKVGLLIDSLKDSQDLLI